MGIKLAPLIQTCKSPAHGIAMRAANRLAAMPERRRNLTDADKEAARKLRALWDSAVPKRKAEGRPLTQEAMAERLASAIGRGTQGLVSQYLNGYIALNYRALLAFADEVGFDPKQVRGDLPEQQLQSAAGIRVSETTIDRAQRQELAEIRTVIGLVAQTLAATIPPAGKELLGALNGLPRRLREGTFVQDTMKAVQGQLPVHPAARNAAKRDARKGR